MGAALSWRQRLGYGAGDFGFNLYFTTASLYLLFFYTDVLGLAPAAAGWVFALALIWDAIFDPLIGYVAGRSHSRWGRYRPYLLIGAVPLAASWALMFVPTGLGGTALFGFALAAHMLFRTLYAVVNMPYLALTAVITMDSKERGVLASIRMIFAAGCGFIAAYSTLKLVALFGGGQAGYLRTALIYGCVATLFIAVSYVNTSEEPAPRGLEPQLDLRAMARMLRQNRAFWVMAAAMLASAIAATVFNKTLPYYVKYVLHREDLIGSTLSASNAAVTLSIPFWTLVMRRTSKQVMWVMGLTLTLIAYPALLVAAHRTDAWMVCVAMIGFGTGASYLGFWSMVPDTIEYGEWRSGVRSEGALFGIVLLIQKAGLGLAAAGLGAFLEWIGFTPNRPQSLDTLTGLQAALIGLPELFTLMTLGALAFYPLRQEVHRRIISALAWRKARAASPPVPSPSTPQDQRSGGLLAVRAHATADPRGMS